MNTDISFCSCWQSWCQYLGSIENADLADICEVSSAAVTGWLNGSRKPRANKIIRLSNFIHELIAERKVVIAPHNRSEFSTIYTTYQHQGDLPTANDIRATFEGNMTVEQVLGLTSTDDQPRVKPSDTFRSKNKQNFLTIFAKPLLALALAVVVVGVAVVGFSTFTTTTNPLFQHSELVLSVDGDVIKVSLSNDGQQRAFLWKQPSRDNYDVYLVNRQQVVTPILQTDADELGLAWSPKGDSLAILRNSKSDTCEFVLLNIETGKETFLTTCNRQTHFDFVWSKDGERLYFTSRKKPNSPFAVYAYSFEDGQVHQLTFPENISYGDYRIIESRSGNKLAFLRSDRWSYSELRTLDLATAKDELFYEFDQIVYSINWGFDDDEILVVPWQSPNQIESILANGERQLITSRSRPIADFELHAERQEIILHESQFTEDIFKTSFNPLSANSLDPSKARPVIASTRSDWQPKLSPDSQTLAFLSNRSGSTELWKSNPDGSIAQPLTKGEIKGMRIFDWSPSGNRIIVDSSDDRVYVIDLATGIIKPYSPIGFVAKNPSWSKDGKKIYVASDTSQAWQIWAIDGALSSPQQITSSGGYHAYESGDGRSLFYTRFYHDGVWQLPLDQPNDLEASIQPVNIVASLKPGAWLQWQVIGEKLYFTERDLEGFRLMQFDLISQRTTKTLDLPSHWRTGFSFFVGNDESDFYFSEKTDQPGSEYILIR